MVSNDSQQAFFQSCVESFAVLELAADGFRSYQNRNTDGTAEVELLDKAQLLTLTAPELTVLIGGMRVLNTLRTDQVWSIHEGAGGVDQRFLH